jgi:hypothetical protein
MAKKAKTPKVNRSAITGRFVSAEFEKKNKHTTIKQAVKKGGKK